MCTMSIPSVAVHLVSIVGVAINNCNKKAHLDMCRSVSFSDNLLSEDEDSFFD